jgi:DNA damage-binding protein 1
MRGTLNTPLPPISLGFEAYCRWRAFRNDRKKALRSKGFIDGDFVEGFLDLDAETRLKVCEGIPEGVEQVQKLVEELSRLH